MKNHRQKALASGKLPGKAAGFLLFLALLFLTARFTGCDPVTFWKRKSHLTDLISGMFPPDFSYARKILLPLFYTIQMSVTGTVLGTVLALVLTPFGATSLQFPTVSPGFWV